MIDLKFNGRSERIRFLLDKVEGLITAVCSVALIINTTFQVGFMDLMVSELVSVARECIVHSIAALEQATSSANAR